MTVAMARLDEEQEELDRRQREILASYGYRLRESDGKAVKAVPVPTGFYRKTDVTQRATGRKTEYHGDCAVRAWAIALHGPGVSDAQYKDVYKDFCRLIREWAFEGRSNALKAVYRNGTRHTKPDVIPEKEVMNRFAAEKGFIWQATSGIGQVETVHVRPDELPGGVLVLKISKHFSAMIDGLLYDIWDTSVSRHVAEDGGRGWRTVYGYWSKP